MGERGPILLEDYHLVEKLANFDRERIPERVVHARGASAKGFFEVRLPSSRARHLVMPACIATRYCCPAGLPPVGLRSPMFNYYSECAVYGLQILCPAARPCL